MIDSRKLLIQVTSGGAVLLVWKLGSILYPGTIPSIQEITSATLHTLTSKGPYGHYFYFHVFKTFKMILISLLIALVIGTILGVSMGLRKYLEDGLNIWVYSLLAIPSVVIVFMAGVLIGFNPVAGFVAVPVVILPFITLNMWKGAANLDEDLGQMANFYGASKLQQLKDVIIPQLLPFLFASIRSGLSIGWKITILVEAFLVTRGIGFMFRYYFDQYNLVKMFSWILIFVVLLLAIEYGLIVRLRRKLAPGSDSKVVKGGE